MTPVKANIGPASHPHIAAYYSHQQDCLLPGERGGHILTCPRLRGGQVTGSDVDLFVGSLGCRL